MTPEVEKTLELIADKTPLVQNEKTHLLARNVERVDAMVKKRYLEVGAITFDGRLKSEPHCFLIKPEGVSCKRDDHNEMARVFCWVHRSVEGALDLRRQLHPRGEIQSQGERGVNRHEEENNQRREEETPGKMSRSDGKTHGGMWGSPAMWGG